METGDLLLRLALLFVAARLAAEIAERLRLPAVLAEIGAGILLGPSLLGIVHGGEPLSLLGELGAILLLLEVGLHMDLGDLRRVGRSAMQVAVIGIVAPMALGFVAVRALGISGSAALFLAAGITATSVGITARVFADMRTLASVEAQTVLGAAVADDVMGLLILTVVTTLSTGGSVALGSIAGITITGLGYLAAVTAAGVWLVPKFFRRVVARSRVDGALVGTVIAFTLFVAGASSGVKLAPIVGAFVAGVVLNRTPQRDDIRRALAPVGHLFVPVFFLLIGAETHVQELASPSVLLVATALGVVAVVGKVVSGLGVPSGKGDRLLVGIGMIPRGEVGLVFATLGLSSGALGPSEHAVLLVVVLLTTMAAPPWLRHRIERRRRVESERAEVAEPSGGWLAVTDDEVELRAEPSVVLVPRIGLEAALQCADRRPGPRLLDWLQRAQPGSADWDGDLRALFGELLRSGNTRSWRLLDVTGLIPVLLPELEPAVRRAAHDPFDLDPGLRWRNVEDLKELAEDPQDPASALWSGVDQYVVLLAGFVLSVVHDEPADAAAQLAQTLALPSGQADTLRFLVTERDLVPAAAARLGMGSENAVLELAAHVGDRPRFDALYLLAAAAEKDHTARERLDELRSLVAAALAQPEVSDAAVDIVQARRDEVLSLLPAATNIAVHRLLADAPRRYLLAHPPAAIARHVQMLDPPPTRGEVRLFPEPHPETPGWTLYVAMLDRPGALASVAGALSTNDIPILEASVTTWPSGLAANIFRVDAPPSTDWESVRKATVAALTHHNGNGKPVAIQGRLEIDNAASPWHTIVELRAADRSGLLYHVARAFARADVRIHHATVHTAAGVAVDSFGVTGPDGHKLDRRRQAELRLAFEGRLPGRWTPSRLWRRPRTEVTAAPK